MKSETGSINESGGLVLALATVAAALALFVPLPGTHAAQAGLHWVTPEKLPPVLGLALAAAGFWVFRRRFWPRSAGECRRLRNGLALMVLQALLLRGALEAGRLPETIAIAGGPVNAWLFTPWFFLIGLAVMLLGSRLGVLLSLSGALLLYLRADPGPLPLVGCLIASLLGVVLLRRSTRGRILRAGLGSGALLGVVAVVQGVLTGASWAWIVAAWALPVLLGLLSAFGVMVLLPLMEWVLGELSDVTLAEYGSGHPLLDQLKEEAPGTWHHTLNVADLAEKAAAVIGARALFCKTATLYHDIGKLKEPGIFAENITGPSPHDDMQPLVSAHRIVEHVTYGLELARKHHLPKAFRDIIAEHHGASVVRFFYSKACAELAEGEDREALRPAFSYSGPPPSSCESGIISLADMVEAATRSVGAKTEAEARAFVRRLIADRVADGELAQCPLTLAQLAQVENTFVTWVQARQHLRPAYPMTSSSSLGTEAGSDWSGPRRAAQPA